ncbi:hypothetical protein [Mycobacterium arosiense]|uniref:hypothetical protein n=1 Tax=Mycobacterium arosiense TaxID=425468 RepID=UPI000AA999FC|nr:hypothetical protein [Mycobacterium arosiense]
MIPACRLAADALDVTDATMVAAEAALTEAETRYVQAARAANTVRGYRSDWAEFTT